jgi:hypothetical protein
VSLVVIAADHPRSTELVRATQPALAEPGPDGLASFHDFGTVVMRASDAPHLYAKTSPWNADESLVRTLDRQIRDGRTFRPVRKLAVASEHKVWSNVDPRFVYDGPPPRPDRRSERAERE